jgi:hypothetical protein
MLLFTQLEIDTTLWVSFGYMVVIGVGLGLCMQSLILAVQNSVELRDLGAATSTVTFFRSLGGSFGVAILGAILTTRLDDELAERLTASGTGTGGGQVSINEPSAILALPEPVRTAIQEAFVAALHPVFLVAGLVAVVAIAVTLAMPDRRLQDGPGHAPAGRDADRDAGRDVDRDAGRDADRDAAEAHARTII